MSTNVQRYGTVLATSRKESGFQSFVLISGKILRKIQASKFGRPRNSKTHGSRFQKTSERSDLHILRLLDKDIYDRDPMMGWIEGFKNKSEEVSNFFVKAKQRKFGNTREIIKELVVFEDDCFSITEDAHECIRDKPFFVVLGFSVYCLSKT